MTESILYPKTKSFENMLYHVRKARPDLEKIEYKGTVKLHGTNSSIVINHKGDVEYQSRNRTISVGDDNFGFCHFMANNFYESEISGISLIEELIKVYLPRVGLEEGQSMIIYGEWAGHGINSGAAICELTQRQFFIFSVLFIDKEGNRSWHPGFSNEHNMKTLNSFEIWDVSQFATFEFELDVNDIERAVNALQWHVSNIERCCPVAESFGIEGAGEGIVWKPLYLPSSDFWFKTKGDKHSVSKVRTLKVVDAEHAKNMKLFAEATVTENRCLQGIEYLKENNLPLITQSTGDFLRWLFNDIADEEGYLLEKHGLKKKDAGKAINAVGKKFWNNYLKQELVA